MHNFIDRPLRRIGGVKCGQLLIWSFVLNVLLVVILWLTFLHTADLTPGELDKKAAELQQMRQSANR